MKKTLLALVLVGLTSLSGCGRPTARNDVTWVLEGDDVRVIEKFVDREGDRRQFFPAASIEKVTTSGSVVTVRSNGETFKVYCFDAKQAGELADVLEKAKNKSSSLNSGEGCPNLEEESLVVAEAVVHSHSRVAIGHESL